MTLGSLAALLALGIEAAVSAAHRGRQYATDLAARSWPEDPAFVAKACGPGSCFTERIVSLWEQGDSRPLLVFFAPFAVRRHL